jgi:tRNA pseudouridine55 synthase
VRLSEYVSASDKRYQATIRLGSSTDTYDAEGTPTEEMPVNVDEEEFLALLKSYEGEQEQVPPPYSAVKIGGQKAYEKARRGEEVELEPRMINVYTLDLLEWAPPEVVVDIHCSSGTYVRSLAHDIGQKLEIGAHLVGLRRTRNGQFSLRDAISLRALQEAFDNGTWAQHLIPAVEALGDWQTVILNAETLDMVVHGHRFANESGMTGWARAISDMGDLVALVEADPDTNEWQPRKVFHTP